MHYTDFICAKTIYASFGLIFCKLLDLTPLKNRKNQVEVLAYIGFLRRFFVYTFIRD